MLWLLASGAATGCYVWFTLDRAQLSARLVSEVPNLSIDHVWPAGGRSFTGYSYRSGQISIQTIRVSSERATAVTRSITAADADPDSIALIRDGAQACWTSLSNLVCFDTNRSHRSQTAVENLESGSAVRITESGVVAVIGPSGSFRLFHLADLQPIVSGTIPVTGVDLTETQGPYIAVAERASGQAAVIDTRTHSRILLTESRNFGTRLSAIALSEAGRLAVATDSGSVICGEKVGVPGVVRGLQFYDQRSFLVAGDFTGVHLIPLEAKSTELSFTEPGARALAAVDEFYVLALPSRVQVFGLRFVTVAGRSAKNAVKFWLGASIIFGLFSCLRLLQRAFQWIKDHLIRGSEHRPKMRKPTDGLKHIPQIMPPPPDLLLSSSNRECFVFAGEELSRMCGMPLWKSFVQGMIDRLYDALVLDPAKADLARAAYHRGELDRVVQALTPFAASHPELLNEYARRMYVKAAALSRTHEALAGIGACGAITPNLDSLLEKSFGLPEGEVFTPTDATDALTCVVRRQFTMMKLRGAFARPETLAVWPSQAMEANAANSALGRFLESVLTTKTLILVGANLDEIEAWLAPAKLDATPARSHYALVPRTDRNSPRKASALLRKYNIHPLAYEPSDENAVLEFLEKLGAARTAAASSPS